VLAKLFFVCYYLDIKELIKLQPYERLKHLRKDVLKINQEEFGNNIGLSRGNVANIEIGRIRLTDRNIKLICSNFNVNEAWLREGIEPIFREQTTDDEIAAFLGDVLSNENDDFKKQLISGLSKLDDDDWRVLEIILDKIVSKKAKD